MPSAVDFELGQRWVPLKAADSGTGLVGVNAAFRQPGTQRAGVHKDLRPGSAAWWRGQGGGHACWEGTLFAADLGMGTLFERDHLP